MLELEAAHDRLLSQLKRFTVKGPPCLPPPQHRGAGDQPDPLHRRAVGDPDLLMLSTTYSKFTELQITLPSADAEKPQDRPRRSSSAWQPMGATINRQPVEGRSRVAGAGAAHAAQGRNDASLIISADAAGRAPVRHPRDGGRASRGPPRVSPSLPRRTLAERAVGPACRPVADGRRPLHAAAAAERRLWPGGHAARAHASTCGAAGACDRGGTWIVGGAGKTPTLSRAAGTPQGAWPAGRRGVTRLPA